MPLNERAELLLTSLIHRYISDGQPVGSRTLARESGLDISPATVRNVMSDLEDMGLIDSPHTSSGRIPTAMGYRMFIDTLLKVRPLTNDAVAEIEDRLHSDQDPQRILSTATEILSRITKFMGVILVPRHQHTGFKQLEFLRLSARRVLVILVTSDGGVQNRVLATAREYAESELVEASNYFNSEYHGQSLEQVRHILLNDMQQDSDEMNRVMKTAVEMAQKMFDSEDAEEQEVLLSGEENLLTVPEFNQLGKLRELFDTFKTKQDLLELLAKSMSATGISIFIGDESGYHALNECSVVAAPYEVDGRSIGTLGVIGPTRMDYAEVIPIVDVTARLLGSALGTLDSDDIPGESTS